MGSYLGDLDSVLGREKETKWSLASSCANKKEKEVQVECFKPENGVYRIYT